MASSENIKEEENKDLKLGKTQTVETTTHLSTRNSNNDPEVGSKSENEADDDDLGGYHLTSEERAQYSRYSNKTKAVMLSICFFANTLAPFASSAFFPATDRIAADFDTTGDIINLTGTVFSIMTAIAPCFFNPLFHFYGVRPIFILLSFLILITSILSAVSVNLVMFFIFRSMSGLFAYTFINMSASICSHIYEPTKRATAMSLTLSGTLSACAFAPVLAGIIITYTHWRVIFWVQSGMCALVLIGSVLFIEETTPEVPFQKWKKESGKKFKLILINPLDVILVLTNPTLFLSGIYTLLMSYTYFAIFAPIRYVVDPRFGFTTPIQGSLFYLPLGIGMLSSSFLAGKLCDRTLKKYIRKRNGHLVGEDRFRSAWIPTVIMAGAILVYGWCLEKEKGGMVLPIICLYVYGFVQTFGYNGTNTYCVGNFPEIGGPIALGSNYFLRNVGSAAGAGATLPMFQSIGIGWSGTVYAVMLIIGLGSIVTISNYGHKMRLNWSLKNGYITQEEMDKELQESQMK